MIQTQLKQIGIDYPQAGETVAKAPYAVRVTAPVEAREVRVSVNDGQWLPCRSDAGHWWLDLNPQGTGEHMAVARVIQNDGTVIVSQPRLFRVKP